MTILPHGRDPRWRFSPSGWNHRPWWKVAVNTVLRAVQRGPHKLVVATVCTTDKPETVTMSSRFAAAGIDVGDVLTCGAPGRDPYRVGVIGKHGVEITVVREPKTIRYRLQRVECR